ncbi:roadblock/LC7 domain-containing protein [Geomonas subterranea]|uniref:Roadblock/LC7 domain-containing protein n=1 Tax=Geomonas subterranea TaxID=2847989 RepID=A0ABX8LFI2_9BACT|nr:roadblock/LC7 domain-containing protein [Geomonas subterranea]QXE90798.1 roadblock/LC7 domain-containing protein [Geomonas subterranea]QXM11120.1 roadblock/LC7 domain-containing protein [Geomonas subterranea]
MPFKRLLTTLVESVPGGNGAILADWEGEAVEQFSHGDPFEMKVTAAHWGILLTQLKAVHDKFTTGAVRETVISTDEQYVIVGAVGDDYALVMTLDRNALPLLALKRFRDTALLLHKEIY